jgi:Thoeris protein ThsB, TIR-like domain
MAVHHIFVSHSWRYGDAYDRLIDLLKAAPNFAYRDFSAPKDDPIHNAPSTAALRAAIEDQMRRTGVVLILAGVYATYSKWINIEIDIAKRNVPLPKPILAIQPWGSEKTSQIVKNAANEIVGWNINSIVSAIRKWD